MKRNFMRLFEIIKTRYEDKLLARAQKIEAERARIEEERLKQEQAQQEQLEAERARIEQARQAKIEEARLREEQRLEQARAQQEKREEQRQIEQEEENKKQEERVQKILESKVPVDYIIELKTKCTDTLQGKEYTYPREDYFICDVPREDLWSKYSTCKFIKITGEDIGKEFTSIDDKELKLVDSKGHIYTRGDSLYLCFLDNYAKRTIRELNESTEKTNEIYKSVRAELIEREEDEKQIKDDIFKL